MNQLNRREWLGSCLALPALAALPAFAALPGSKAPLLLRSSWQTVNIGDVAHTPGMLTLLEKYFPDQKVWLWPSNVNNGV
jgi:hypothetical protein